MKNTFILYIILGALLWSYLRSVFAALSRRIKTAETKRTPEESSVQKTEPTEESSAALSEATELLRDPTFRRLVAMHRMEQKYGGTWRLLLPTKPAATEDSDNERYAA
jgi:hypothetical protein